MRTCRVVFAWLLVALPSWGVHAEGLTDYFPPPESKGDWRSLLPENGPPDAAQKETIRATAGMDWDKLAEAWEHNLRADGPSMLPVIRRGHIVGEWYNDGYLIPSLDLVFVRLDHGEKFPPAFQSDLVKKVRAAVEK